MSSPLVLVTSATGHTGSPTVAELLARGLRVRALVHREDARAQRLRAQGADLLVGSLDDPADVARALHGVQRAYFAAPFLPGALRVASIFAEAAEEARLEAIVVLSQWLADPAHPSVHTRETWLADRRFAALRDTAVITVNPGWFADNYMAGLGLAAQLGLFTMPLGHGRNAPPSNEDIARVVAGALADPTAHAGRSYRPTGPALLDPDEIAAVFGRVLGHRVRYRDASPALFSKVARTIGFPDYVTASVLTYLEDYRRDAFSIGAPTDSVEAIAGRPAEDFETIVRRYVAAAPDARRSVGGQLRAMRTLARVMATPALDRVATDRTYGVGNTAHAVAAVDSRSWRERHDVGALPSAS